MKIPASFTMLGHKWTVRVIPKEQWKKPKDIGHCDLSIALIELKDGHPTVVEQTFLHEVIHIALFYMGEDKLSFNETFVDLLAGLLHQAEASRDG